jgi:hypothetical protein
MERTESTKQTKGKGKETAAYHQKYIKTTDSTNGALKVTKEIKKVVEVLRRPDFLDPYDNQGGPSNPVENVGSLSDITDNRSFSPGREIPGVDDIGRRAQLQREELSRMRYTFGEPYEHEGVTYCQLYDPQGDPVGSENGRYQAHCELNVSGGVVGYRVVDYAPTQPRSPVVCDAQSIAGPHMPPVDQPYQPAIAQPAFGFPPAGQPGWPVVFAPLPMVVGDQLGRLMVVLVQPVLMVDAWGRQVLVYHPIRPPGPDCCCTTL